MRYKSILLLVFYFVPVVSIAQLSLTIEINQLRSNNGHIHLELIDENKEQVAAISENISDGKCVFVIENLKPGNYAFKFIHDENNNEKLDTNFIGIPKEGFGFSNNPGMTFGPPSFDETIFELKRSVVINCKPKYF